MSISRVISLAILGVVAVTGVVHAEAFPATANVIVVQATSGASSATFEEVFPVSSFDGQLSWTLPGPLTLSDGATELGVVENLSVAFDADPQIDLQFAVRNSSLTDPIFFNISTATIVFTPLYDAVAAASASVTLTQGAGSPAGGSISGQFPDGKMYQARYSTDPVIDTNTVFANLASSMMFTSGLGTSQTEMLPASGFSDLNTTVHMMESEFKFILSAGDQASGTSAFLIDGVIPEPASLSLLALGGLVACLRRRRVN